MRTAGPMDIGRHRRWVLAGLLSVAAGLAMAAGPEAPVGPSMRGTWRVTVQGIPDGQPRVLVVSDASGHDTTDALAAVYGIVGRSTAAVTARVERLPATRRLQIQTPAQSTIVADERPDGTFAGTLTTRAGKTHAVTLARIDAPPPAAPAGPRRDIVIVNMGGNDCPPCVAWRRFELPRLQAAPDFAGLRFVHVEKAVQSAVPPTSFLPDEARPFKSRLDAASGGMSGSPQVAVFVDGEVFDYYHGTRTAEEMLAMVRSIRAGTRYPFERCLQRRDRLHCAEPAPR